jgi:lysophospholipase L1-like esterase
MTIRSLCLAVLVALPLAACQHAAPQGAPAAPKADASAALPKKDDKFLVRHESYLARARSGPVGLLFLGDSITERWQIAPHIWDAYFGKYQAANFGIGGNRTQNVIWQIEHGALDGIAPKVTVLMIGTNNSLDYNAADIAAAARKIVAMIRARLPQTKILVLGILPRGPRPLKEGAAPAPFDDPAQRKLTIDAVNRDLAGLDDGKTIRFLDIGPLFLGQDGRIPYSIMPDQLHPNAAGYQIMADAMRALVDSMMK